MASQLEKVWVSVYDDLLSDEQVKRLAHMHNSLDEGSRKTSWFDRVKACRSWAYRMAGVTAEESTSDTSTEWRKSCQRMFVSSEKVKGTQMFAC